MDESQRKRLQVEKVRESLATVVSNIAANWDGVVTGVGLSVDSGVLERLLDAYERDEARMDKDEREAREDWWAGEDDDRAERLHAQRVERRAATEDDR